jgi:drug/metabolite transporter (DMT)-like permease
MTKHYTSFYTGYAFPQSRMTLPPPIRPPAAERPASPAWRWLLLLGLAGLFLALALGFAGLRDGGSLRPAAGLALAGLLALGLGLGRRHRAHQALTWHGRARRWQ